MEVYKKINNNVALARDAKGRELVVFGKGIGFASMPYELTDLSRIQRTFYDVNEKYFALLRDVPEAVFLAADDIADTAREELDCTLNANLTYALVPWPTISTLPSSAAAKDLTSRCRLPMISSISTRRSTPSQNRGCTRCAAVWRWICRTPRS